LPRLSGWAGQLTDEDRYTSLETILARAEVSSPLASQLDPLRMKLLGQSKDDKRGEEVPVAALGLLAAGIIPTTDNAYHLRLDPVTLQADISRVVLMGSDFSSFPANYQQQVLDIIRQVLADDGLELRVSDFWSISLPQHPAVQFTSLDDALGADVSECLPEGPAGQRWKRLSNDIQMALHASAANQQRRQRGEALINGAWFWGGGQLPGRAESCLYDQVFSNDPVSAGLARLQDVAPVLPGELLNAMQVGGCAAAIFPPGSLLVDWAIPAALKQAANIVLTPARLEAFCAVALARLKSQGGILELHNPEICLRLTPAMLKRFWRRPKPLRRQLMQMFSSVMPNRGEA